MRPISYFTAIMLWAFTTLYLCSSAQTSRKINYHGYYILLEDSTFQYTCDFVDWRDSSILALRIMDSSLIEIPVSEIYSLKMIRYEKPRPLFYWWPGPASFGSGNDFSGGSDKTYSISYYHNMHFPGYGTDNPNLKSKPQTYLIKGRQTAYLGARAKLTEAMKRDSLEWSR